MEFSEHFERYIILSINKDDFLIWHLNEKLITERCITIIIIISSNNRNKIRLRSNEHDKI